MGRVLETPVQKRFSDLDPFRHVNNVAQQSYFDVGKTDFYARVLGEEVLLGDLRVVTVSTSTSYMGQVRMHDDVRVTTTCEKVGNKSMTLFQRLVVDGGGAQRKQVGAGRLRLRPAGEPSRARCVAGAAYGGVSRPVSRQGGRSAGRSSGGRGRAFRSGLSRGILCRLRPLSARSGFLSCLL